MVVNTVVRMFTRRAVRKAMKSAKSAVGKKGTKKARGPKKKGTSEGKKVG